MVKKHIFYYINYKIYLSQTLLFFFFILVFIIFRNMFKNLFLSSPRSLHHSLSLGLLLTQANLWHHLQLLSLNLHLPSPNFLGHSPNDLTLLPKTYVNSLFNNTLSPPISIIFFLSTLMVLFSLNQWDFIFLSRL